MKQHIVYAPAEQYPIIASVADPEGRLILIRQESPRRYIMYSPVTKAETPKLSKKELGVILENWGYENLVY